MLYILLVNNYSKFFNLKLENLKAMVEILSNACLKQVQDIILRIISTSTTIKKILKAIKASKQLDDLINKAAFKLDKTFKVTDGHNDNKSYSYKKNINGFCSLINHQEEPDIKQIKTLKIDSSNLCIFKNNFLIIKSKFKENNSSENIVRWLKISKSNLQLWIDKYFK